MQWNYLLRFFFQGMYNNHSVNSSGLILRGTAELYSWRKGIIPVPSCNNSFFLINIAAYVLITASDAGGRKRKSMAGLGKARSYPALLPSHLVTFRLNCQHWFEGGTIPGRRNSGKAQMSGYFCKCKA